jgi:nicotinamidase-related amidase
MPAADALDPANTALVPVGLTDRLGGFQGTGLGDRLRGCSGTTSVLGGIATDPGVESTAHAAADVGYGLPSAEDAVAAFTAAGHEASVGLDFPRLGSVVTASQVRLTAG